MARRDLSRTVIEGGRYHRNTFFRRESHRTARATTRDWLSSIEHDPDEADASSPPPLRPVHKQFYDKLAPARRWLASQVGRPWDKVHSELRAQFDSRTIAGAHVVNDHMLGWVAQHGLARATRRSYDFDVDAHGILRLGRYYKFAYRTMRGEILAWQAGRRATLTYRGWWWVRVVALDPRCYAWKCREKHIDGHHRAEVIGVGPLTKGDLRRLDRLPDDFRAGVVLARCEVRF